MQTKTRNKFSYNSVSTLTAKNKLVTVTSKEVHLCLKTKKYLDFTLDTLTTTARHARQEAALNSYL